MGFFTDLLKNENKQTKINDRIALFEHQLYKQIPGTRNSYRQDTGNTSTITQKHAHVYTKLSGKGNELYSVNIDGSGHDGSSGIEIPSSHANYLRNMGYKISDINILETLEFDSLDENTYDLIIIEDEV
ncbi:hypothetical protein [Sulfuricurvum sp.]|uniref:hypothetical protein n=1 Tax=Sulfuricurvum sp. TaxID=2025608 RepID=UPI00260376D6|nr:hypothetical protein [Sulfuricurvum sp.]MDD3596784.1 hypothetical protein [Sulfuricurvum sp.]